MVRGGGPGQGEGYPGPSTSQLLLKYRTSVQQSRRLWQSRGVGPKVAKEEFAPRFRGIISECFDAYLSTWVKHEEKQLMEVLQNLTSADKMVGHDEDNDEDEDESLEPRYLYKSAPELFRRHEG